VTTPLDTLIRSEPIVRLIADHPDAGQRIRALPGVLSVLGCDVGCDVVLDSDRVEDVHAAIARLSSGTYLCDLGALSGTSLNRRLIRWSRLATGDMISVGPFELGIEMEDRADVAIQGLPVFSLRNDQEVGLVSSIDPVLIVGSDPGCDVVLQGRSVLPRHCIVIWTEEGPIIRDLLRRELTRLNGKRVNMGRLMHGDAIGVGPYELYFETEIDVPRRLKGAGRSIGSPIAVSKRLSDDALLIAGRLPLEQVEAARHLWPGPVAPSESQSVILRDRPADAEPAFEAQVPFLIELADSASRIAEETHAATGEMEAPDTGTVEQVEQAELLAALEASPDAEAPAPLPEMETIDPELLSETASTEAEADAASTDHAAESPPAAATAAAQPDAAASKPGDPIPTEHPVEEPTSRHLDEIVTSSPESPAAPEAVEDVSAHKESTMANDRETAGADVSSEKPSMQEYIHKRTERLDSKTDELRRRVAAAQAALDERAGKHRARLEEERGRLEQRRSDLRRQATALLHASGGQPPSERSEAEPPVDAIVPSHAQVDSLLSGEVELSEATNQRATESRLGLTESSAADTSSEDMSLEERAAELINVAKRERREIEKGESLIESLRFETERRRASLGRRREKLEQREAAVEERFTELEKDKTAIAKEREPLEAQLHRLVEEEQAIQSRIGESRRIREDLDREADGLRLEQENLERRRRELLNNLETERDRLQMRQAELHRKAAELAEAAREKRMHVEAEMSKRQLALQEQEADLRAQRLEIEDSTRRELERTAKELEQVLQVRLNDIDDELVSRKADLDARVEELSGSTKPFAYERMSGPTDSIEAPLREIAEELAAPRRGDDSGVRRGLRLGGPGMAASAGRRDAKLRMAEDAEPAKPVDEEEAVAVGSGENDGKDAPEAAETCGGSEA